MEKKKRPNYTGMRRKKFSDRKLCTVCLRRPRDIEGILTCAVCKEYGRQRRLEYRKMVDDAKPPVGTDCAICGTNTYPMDYILGERGKGTSYLNCKVDGKGEMEERIGKGEAVHKGCLIEGVKQGGWKATPRMMMRKKKEEYGLVETTDLM